MRHHWIFALGLLLGLACPAQQDKPPSRFPVLTVCEAMQDLPRYSGMTLMIVGVDVTSMEFSVLTQDCPHKFKWGDNISISGPYGPGVTQPAPHVPTDYDWNADSVLDRKMDEVIQSTKLAHRASYRGIDYSDRYTAVYGRLETRITASTKVEGELPSPLGYGHRNGSPAALVYDFDSGIRFLQQ